jgi:hypothetical protein
MPKVIINGREVYIPDSTTTVDEIRQAGNIGQQRNLILRTREGNYLVPKHSPVNVNEGDQFIDAPARIKGVGPARNYTFDDIFFAVLGFFGLKDSPQSKDIVQPMPGTSPKPTPCQAGAENRQSTILYNEMLMVAPQTFQPVIRPEPTVPVSLPFSFRPENRQSRIYNEIMMIAPNFSKHEGVCFDEEKPDWLMIPKYPLPAKWQNRWCKLMIIFPQGYPITPPIGFYLNRKFKLKSGATDPHLTGAPHDGATDLRAQGWEWYCVRLEQNSAGGWKPGPDYRKPDNLRTFLAMVRESLTNDV